MDDVALGTCIVVHDAWRYLGETIAAFLPAGPVICYVSRVPWGPQEPGDWEKTVETVGRAGGIAVLVDHPNESLHRREAYKDMRRRGFTHCFVADGDELIELKLLQTLIAIAKCRLAERVHVTIDTYWKSVEYRIRPREALTPIILIDLEKVEHLTIREFSGGRKLVLGAEYGVVHHLSYCGDADYIARKIKNSSHAPEILKDWFQNKYLAWDDNKLLRDFHPTHAPAYHKAERIVPPEVLSGIAVEEREEIIPCIPWPRLSIVIPLHGGCEDIRLCLESLLLNRELVYEIVVVDDASPDRAAMVAAKFEGVRVIKNPKNLGFAATCNIGYRATSGEIIIFLNSDTIVSRAGLIRLIESLMASRFIAAAGPYSNYTGHHQQIASTYDSLETMPLFADDLARMDLDNPEAEVDMLVGFCLAVKKEVLEEIGLFDERFGIGMFEDNDLCFRMRRSGYKLVLSRQSFIHHTGSRSLARRKEHPAVLMARNQRIYLDKWKDDLECGFVNHLSGMSADPIIFNPARKPEELDKRIKRLSKKAGITLCMIVKNESRVLRACLTSVRGAFVRIIIIDTGSSDDTIAIGREFGAVIHEIPWPDSYSDARNISLRYASSPWTYWMDADDTIDRDSLIAMLEAAIRFRGQKVAFIIPVRFVDQGPYGGMQVDHLKLFPTIPGVAFEGYVHEQILGSLRAHGVEPARLKGALIRHSGYDTSVEGQMQKRTREKRLLKKDYDADPQNPFKRYNPGMTCHHMGEHEEAVRWLEMCLEIAKPEESIVKSAYSMLGVSKRELGDIDGALAAFNKGLEVCPEEPELLFQLAITLTGLGRLVEAKDCYLRISPEIPESLSSIDIGILTYKRFHNLAAVCMGLGGYTDAKEWWKMAISAAPTFAPSPLEYFEAAISHADFQGAGEALAALQVATGPSEAWAARLCKLAEVTGQNPEQAIRGVLQHSPYAIGPLLVLAKMLMARGEDASSLLFELERLGCAEGAYFGGLLALQRVDLWAALARMSRAHELNPIHEETEKHLKELRRILAAEMPPPLKGSRKKLLKGPHAGRLGPGTCPNSLVVVTYNSAVTLSECVERVLSTIGLDDELILVDNASTDGTRHVINSLSDPRVKVILNEENLGYSRAANIGALASKGKNVVWLNPDAYVDGGWLESMSGCLGGDVAAVGPMSDNIGGGQFVGHLLDGRHPPVGELSALLKVEFAGRNEETKFLVGICVMVRRETLDKHGLLDEGTELGADDLEFSWRLRMLGYKLAIAQDVFVRHEQGVSFSSLPHQERMKRQARSDAALYRKLEAFYGKGNIPSSMELWDTPIFDEAMERVRMLD